MKLKFILDDNNQLDTFYIKIKTRLQFLCRKFSVTNLSEDELFNEVMLKMLLRRNKLTGDEDAERYFLKSCENFLNEKIRKTKSKSYLKTTSIEMEDFPITDNMDEETNLFEEKIKLFERNLNKLNDDCKKIINNIIVFDGSYNINSFIAQTFNLSLNSASKKKKRCEEDLKTLCENDYNELLKQEQWIRK